MLKTALLTCLLTCTAATVAAESNADATKRSPEMDAAVELLALMDMDKMMAGMQEHVEMMLHSQIQPLASCAAAQPAVETFSKEASALITNQLSGETFLPEIAELYVEVFSLDELQGMIEFYRSPLGQKLLARMPELMQRSMSIGEQQMMAVMPKLEEISTRFGSEIAAAEAQCNENAAFEEE